MRAGAGEISPKGARVRPNPPVSSGGPENRRSFQTGASRLIRSPVNSASDSRHQAVERQPARSRRIRVSAGTTAKPSRPDFAGLGVKPGCNRDRGPVLIPGFRATWSFDPPPPGNGAGHFGASSGRTALPESRPVLVASWIHAKNPYPDALAAVRGQTARG